METKRLRYILINTDMKKLTFSEFLIENVDKKERRRLEKLRIQLEKGDNPIVNGNSRTSDYDINDIEKLGYLESFSRRIGRTESEVGYYCVKDVKFRIVYGFAKPQQRDVKQGDEIEVFEVDYS